MKYRFFNKILYIIVSLVLIVVILINFTVLPVQAATEIESLPATVDVTVSYDSDSVIMTYLGETYTIDRNHSLLSLNGYLRYGNGSGLSNWSYLKFAPYCDHIFNYPVSLESDYYGNKCPCSYWYSPTTNKIYIITGSLVNDGSYDYNLDPEYPYNEYYSVISYSDGHFYFKNKSNSTYFYPLYLTIVDLTDMSYCFIGSLNSMSSPSYYDIDSYSTTYNNAGYTDFPTDLICVFANHGISGFFDTDGNSVVTPDYYFDYQYIFYTSGSGYVFVDSAQPLVSISNSDPTKAILTFDDFCNKYIYTSSDGSVWHQLVDLSLMYGDVYSMDYSYFYDSQGGSACYTLVYSNDSSFDDDPVITPEYGELEDIILDLNECWDLSSSFTYQENWNSAYYSSDYEWIIYSVLFNDFLNVDFRDPNGYLYNFNGITIYGLVKDIDNNIRNVESTLYAYLPGIRDSLHDDLGSVFDNISLTNTYFSRLLDKIDSLPTYYSKLNNIQNEITSLIAIDSSIEQVLSDMDFSVGSASGSVTFDDTDIVDNLTEINEDLDKIQGLLVIDTFDELFDDDYFSDDYSDIPDFVNNSISGVQISAATTLDFDPTVVNGARWINSTIMIFWDSMQPLQSVILLGASFLVINHVVRKGGDG